MSVGGRPHVSASATKLIQKSEGLGDLSYNGWKILTWRFHHSDPNLPTLHISISELLGEIKELFAGREWVFQVDSLESGVGSLAHIPTKYDISVEVHGEELSINYDTGLKKETYLVTMRSEVLTWKQEERRHKEFMVDVWKLVPWDWEKVACYLIDSTHQVVRSSNIEEERVDPFEVIPERWKSCPIPPLPEKKRRQRVITRLRLAPKTSYLGTRIRVPRRRRNESISDDF